MHGRLQDRPASVQATSRRLKRLEGASEVIADGMASTRPNKILVSVAAVAICLLPVASSAAKMRSQRIGPNVCLTSGGGGFAAVPGFPGERIDRRLLGDVDYLRKRYKIFVTDGLSGDPVHAANGEHPIGLALDIVPDRAAGGTWRDIDALARFAEPRQNQPRAPFRWVGYDGDAGHGHGNHLHLSWNHSETRPGVPAKSVYTLRCPDPGGGEETSGGGGSKGGKGNGGAHSGGVEPGEGGGGHSGGVGTDRIEAELTRQAADPVIETGGIGRGR